MFYNIFSVCSTLFILQLMKIKILLKPKFAAGELRPLRITNHNLNIHTHEKNAIRCCCNGPAVSGLR